MTEPVPASPPRRTVRSFVRREGRFTKAQQQACEQFWPRYGIDNAATALNLPALFGRAAPKILEIGFGMGEGLAQIAAAHPENDYLGIEVHRPGIGTLLRRLDEGQLCNVRVICDDAVEVLKQRIADGSLDTVQLFFPDPWPKKRHHKRRIIQPEFVELIRRRLRPGGTLHLATDWEHYAQHMLAVLNQAPGMANALADGFAPRPETRPLTRFEQRGQRLGHGVWDLIFTRTD